MDDFQKIDWKPAISDVVDNEFVSMDRFEKSSVMYRILRNELLDPLKNIADDFMDQVKAEDVEALAQENKDKQRQRQLEKAPKENIDHGKDPKKWIPGIVPCPARFPRHSSLTPDQQEICMKILMHFSSSSKPDLTAINKDELTTYMNLQSMINKEQEEFMEIAQGHWDPSKLKVDREDLINLKWKSKLEYARELHRYYSDFGTIPFVSERDIKFGLASTLLDKIKVPKFELPCPKFRYKMSLQTPMIDLKYFTPEKLKVKNQISEDKNCQNLAEHNDIDLVISTSGLQCLASNLDPSYSQVWILPVHIKEINGRNVVFIDKPLPPHAKTVIQKNSWIYKYAIKRYFLKDDTLQNVSEVQSTFVDVDKPVEDAMDVDEHCTEPPAVENNYQYNLFTIGACGTLQNDLMKTKIDKDFNILVRSKIDGVEIDRDTGEKVLVKIAPKLEHQLGFGAEAVSLEEAARQWIVTAFTPDVCLVRLRICQYNGNYIQHERRTSMSINNELSRLYSVRGEEILGLIYNIADSMTKMSPGKYLLRHTIRNGAFVSVYKESEASSKNTIDLHGIYCEEEFRTVSNAKWPLIDKTLLTPALIAFKRMPAMFHPSRRLQEYQKTIANYTKKRKMWMRKNK